MGHLKNGEPYLMKKNKSTVICGYRSMPGK
jgi:hypothetical protein